MKSIFKLIIFCMIFSMIFSTISCDNKKEKNTYINKDVIETENFIKDICSKSDSNYFNLFKGINHSFLRGLYIINLNNGHQVRFKKINNQYFYTTYGDIHSKDTSVILHELNSFSKEFEEKYEWDIENAKKFIDFCYRVNLMKLFVREEEQYISIITLYCQILYTKEKPRFDYERKLCYDWYLTDIKRFND